MCHSKWKQNYSNSVTFVAKKAKETLIIGLTLSHSYWNKNIWKPPLNPRALACFENLSKCPLSCPSLFGSILPILNYSDTLCELKLKKSYTVHIIEKYIPLLQVTKYIMLRSLLKYAWKGFEIVLRHYLIFKTLNFMHMNFPGNFHPTWMLWVIYKQTLF